MGDLTLDEQTLRLERYNEPSWEVGGDFETDLGKDWSLKIIGLFSNKDRDSSQQEDYSYDGTTFLEDISSNSDRIAKEYIARASLSYGGIENHDIEFGSELAINKLDTGLEFFSRENNVLVPIEVGNSNVHAEETRVESFINDTWKLSSKTTLETILKAEYSEISVTGDATKERSFFFLKPSVDLRHNINSTNQVKLSAIRSVGQLDFNDFASSISNDDDVVGGNEDIVPWKNWRIQLDYERRFNEGSGTIKISAYTKPATDAWEQVEVAPGVSGKGNIGKVEEYGLDLQSSFGLDFMGMKGAVLDITTGIGSAKFTDSFTGERRTPAWFNNTKLRGQLRQDINSLGLSYEINLWYHDPTNYVDIDDIIEQAGPRFMVWGSVTKRIMKGLFVSFGAGPIFNVDNGRNRFRYADGIVSGIITSRELRKRHNGRRYSITLKGSF